MMCAPRTHRLRKAIGVAPDLAYRISASHTVPDLVHVCLQVSRDDAAAGQPKGEGHSFLSRPDDHLQRVPGTDACGSNGFEHAQCRERSEIAVEVASVRHRINVRAEEDWRQSRIGSGTPTEDVPRWVYARFKSRRLHQADDVPAASDVRI